MNKLSKLLYGTAALAMMASCSSNEPNGPENRTPAGDVAYMKIQISTASETRATDDSNVNDNYKESTVLEEHDVNSLEFFFFDENGNNANLKATVVNPNETAANDSKHNVEFISDAGYLVLEGLRQNDYPSYMLTVINAPGFECPGTLAEASRELYNYNTTTATATTGTGFVMSTSSYFKKDAVDNNHNDSYYYATKLDSSDFKSTIDAAKTDSPVQVYVERLAAKAEVKVSAPSTNATKDGQNITIYALSQTLGGGDNQGSGTLDVLLYVHILGWGLNATNPDSYLSKQLQSGWATTDPYTGWNDPTRYRSFWAESTAYTLDAAALENKLVFNKAEIADEDNPTKFVPFFNKAVNTGVDYCNENTHEAGTLLYDKNAADSRHLTHVVLDTEVGTLENGVFKPITLITYRGLLYRENDFQDYILSVMQNKKQINLYVQSGSDYKQIDRTYLTYEGANDGLGSVNLILDESKRGSLYMKAADGSYTGANDEAITAFKNNIAAAQVKSAVRHTTGRSVYYIPIEHHALAGSETVTASDPSDLGYYGMVRNHWYQLDITKFSRVGHGVYDPTTEVVKPSGPEDPLYYVGAKINILSWKLVKQTVVL